MTQQVCMVEMWPYSIIPFHCLAAFLAMMVNVAYDDQICQAFALNFVFLTCVGILHSCLMAVAKAQNTLWWFNIMAFIAEITWLVKLGNQVMSCGHIFYLGMDYFAPNVSNIVLVVASLLVTANLSEYAMLYCSMRHHRNQRLMEPEAA
jgi:hypothetical protein